MCRCYSLSASGHLWCYSPSPSAKLPLTRGTAEPNSGGSVQLFAACLDILFFSWATQCARPLQQSGHAFRILLEEFAKVLRLEIELHPPARRQNQGSQKVRQCRKVCLEIRCCSYMVGCGRTPKLLGVLGALRRVLMCKIRGRCEESSSERCCNLGGNAEVCHCVGCCSQDYVYSGLPSVAGENVTRRPGGAHNRARRFPRARLRSGAPAWAARLLPRPGRGLSRASARC